MLRNAMGAYGSCGDQHDECVWSNVVSVTMEWVQCCKCYEGVGGCPML